MTEFNLSKKIVYGKIQDTQVKEFIKLLLNTDWDVEPCCHGINQRDFIKRVSSLAGEKLI